MAWGKTEEQKIAEKAMRDAEARALQEQQALAAYAASPPGRADAAYRNGNQFFQLELPLHEKRGAKTLPGVPHAGILEEIESVGWHLEHASYVFLEGTSSNTPLPFGGVSVSSHDGQIVAIYLFRRIASQHA